MSRAINYEYLINAYQDAMNFWRAMGNEKRYRIAKEDLNNVLEFRFNEIMKGSLNNA